MFSLICSQILIETSAFPRRQALWLADGNRDVGTSPRPGWDSQPQQGSCPAREWLPQIQRTATGGRPARTERGPLRPGAYFHYQGYIPRIPWFPGTHYQRIKVPKENTHLKLRLGLFIFIVGH